MTSYLKVCSLATTLQLDPARTLPLNTVLRDINVHQLQQCSHAVGPENLFLNPDPLPHRGFHFSVEPLLLELLSPLWRQYLSRSISPLGHYHGR